MNYKNQIFREDDVIKLVSLIPKSWYRSENSFKVFLEELVSKGDDMKDILNLYPNVLCEPLDDYYILFRLISNSSEDLIFDLLHEWHTKMPPIAALLAIFSPNKEYKNYFINLRDGLINPHNKWIVELAIAEINGVSWQLFPEISNLLYRLKKQIERINLPKSFLRKALTNDELEFKAGINAQIKKIYKEKGTDAALAIIKTFNIH